MSLLGSAFLIMWHDIAPEAEVEYSRWHTVEHMPERIDLPGFLRARRGVNWELQHQRYLTIYEGNSLEAFRTPEYMKSLNYPTVWTTRMAPHFRNFLRVSCATVVSRGKGVGGAIATYRCNIGSGDDAVKILSQMNPILDFILEMHGISSVHVGAAQTEYSSIPTRETLLRPVMHEDSFDLIVVVDGIGLREVGASDAAISTAIASIDGIKKVKSHVYDMAYLLEKTSG